MMWWLATALAAPMTADEAVSLSLTRSVEVAQATAQVTAAAGQTRATSLFRSDPRIQGSWAAVGSAHNVSISQPVSLTGGGIAANRSARAQLARAEASLARTELEIAAATRVSWVAAVEAQQQVVLAQEGLALASRLREGAEARQQTGDGSLLDARLARLQEAEAQSTWMVAVSREAQRLAELSTWTGVAVAALDLPSDPLEGMAAVTLERTERTDLAAAQQAVQAARARLGQERADTLPPVRIGAFYEQEDGALRIGPSLQLTVPLWQRNAQGRAQASGAVAVAESALAERQRVVAAEQQATAAVLDKLDAVGPIASDPRAEATEALQSVALGFERGELDLLTAGLLRQQILQGQSAWLQGRRIRAEARIAAALAHEASALAPQD